MGLQSGEELLPDALNLHEVLDASERTVLLAVRHDPVGELYADARQARELGRGRLTDVDDFVRGRRARGRGQARRARGRLDGEPLETPFRFVFVVEIQDITGFWCVPSAVSRARPGARAVSLHPASPPSTRSSQDPCPALAGRAKALLLHGFFPVRGLGRETRLSGFSVSSFPATRRRSLRLHHLPWPH